MLKQRNNQTIFSLKGIKHSLCNKLLKSQLLNGLYFDQSICYGEDALFCWRYINKCRNAIVTSVQLYHYRKNPNSITHQKFCYTKLSIECVLEIINIETSQL